MGVGQTKAHKIPSGLISSVNPLFFGPHSVNGVVKSVPTTTSYGSPSIDTIRPYQAHASVLCSYRADSIKYQIICQIDVYAGINYILKLFIKFISTQVVSFSG